MGTLQDSLKCLEEAFYKAAACGCDSVVRLLLEAGIDVHAGNDLALQAAAACGKTNVVTTLLIAGANPYVGDGLAAEIAEKLGHPKTARTLRDWIASHPPSSERSPSSIIR